MIPVGDPLDRAGILRDLESSDDELRRFAVERVTVLPADESLALLAGVLGDPSWRVRKAVVERLIAHAQTGALASVLIEALADGDNPGRRNSAVEALVECGSRMVPFLLEAAAIDDTDVRKFVVDVLAGIGDAEAGAPLLELLGDPDANVRAAAADALGALATPASSDALLALAVDGDEDPTVRFSCLRALGSRDEALWARDLTAVLEDPILRAAGLDLLRCPGDQETVAVLLKGLAAGAGSVREAAIRSLLRLLGRSDGEGAARLLEQLRAAAAAAPAAAEGAIARLGEADLATRMVLIQFLGLLQDGRAALPILEAGRDEALCQVALETLAAMGAAAEDALDGAWESLDDQQRCSACALFGRTHGERAVARLLHALQDVEPQVRMVAARALGECRQASAAPALIQRLASVSSQPDFEAEDEMGTMADALIAIAGPGPERAPVAAEVVELLRLRLDESGEVVRLEIARVLGAIGQREDGRILGLLLKDPSARVRRAAVEALARLEPGTAAEPLRLALADDAVTVRIAAASALGASQNEEVMDDLLRLADDADAQMRAAAVRALGGRFGDSPNDARRSAALEVLDRALGDDALVAMSAVQALNELGGEAAGRATGVLTRGEPELVKEAVSCIAHHGDVRALETIAPLVSHPDWSVRAEVIESLAHRGVVRAVPSILRQLERERDDFVRDVMLRALKVLEV